MLIYQGESALSNQFDNRLRVVPHSVPHRSICFRFLRDSRASETRAREKITSREKKRLVACRLFSRGVIFTRARLSLALLSLRKNGGLVVVCFDNLVQRMIIRSGLEINCVIHWIGLSISSATGARSASPAGKKRLEYYASPSSNTNVCSKKKE